KLAIALGCKAVRVCRSSDQIIYGRPGIAGYQWSGRFQGCMRRFERMIGNNSPPVPRAPPRHRDVVDWEAGGRQSARDGARARPSLTSPDDLCELRSSVWER